MGSNPRLPYKLVITVVLEANRFRYLTLGAPAGHSRKSDKKNFFTIYLSYKDAPPSFAMGNTIRRREISQIKMFNPNGIYVGRIFMFKVHGLVSLLILVKHFD